MKSQALAVLFLAGLFAVPVVQSAVSYTVAEDGSARTQGFRVAEDGSDRTQGFRVAEGGADRSNRVA